MEKDTIKLALIKYLEEKGNSWTFGRVICRELSSILKHKESVIERHGLRSNLVKGINPIIESKLVPNPNGKGSKVKMYRIKEDNVVKYPSENSDSKNIKKEVMGTLPTNNLQETRKELLHLQSKELGGSELPMRSLFP